MKAARALWHRLVSQEARSRLHWRRKRLLARPRVGAVHFGSLRRVVPIARDFGFERGTPVDRFYIDEFYEKHGPSIENLDAGAIRGRVLEIGEPHYTRRFGDPEAVDRVDVLDIVHGRGVTYVDDLANAPSVPSCSFDCVVCPQTLFLIYDVRAAVRTLHRILRPGGVVLATVPGISQICPSNGAAWEDQWRLTPTSALRLFEEAFEPGSVTVESYGNVLAATAFLHGLGIEELDEDELRARDPEYPLVITVEAIKT